MTDLKLYDSDEGTGDTLRVTASRKRRTELLFQTYEASASEATGLWVDRQDIERLNAVLARWLELTDGA